MLPERRMERRVCKSSWLITRHNTIWTNNGVEGKEYKERDLTTSLRRSPDSQGTSLVLLQDMNSVCQELGPRKFSTSYLIYVSEVVILHGLHSLSFIISLRLTRSIQNEIDHRTLTRKKRLSVILFCK